LPHAPKDAERLDHFMARAAAAYYAARDPFQDFVTSPEILRLLGNALGFGQR
jgi:SAM-dependent MidA family methyltransferase